MGTAGLCQGRCRAQKEIKFADLSSESEISRARKWLRGAAPDDLFVTDGISCAEENTFDQVMAEMRWSMMLESLDRIANALPANHKNQDSSR